MNPVDQDLKAVGSIVHQRPALHCKRNIEGEFLTDLERCVFLGCCLEIDINFADGICVCVMQKQFEFVGLTGLGRMNHDPKGHCHPKGGGISRTIHPGYASPEDVQQPLANRYVVTNQGAVDPHD